SGVDLKIDQAPLVLCDLFVFGRETDRAARVETSVPQTQVDQVKTALGEIGGDALGACTSTESGETADAVSVAMSHSWRFPADTPAELRQSLAVQKREESMLHTWPTIALTCLDGKSAEQVQGDAKYRVRLLAAIFLIELQWQQNGWDFDFNRLRTQLQLPTADPIDPAGVDLERLPLVRYGRLDPKGVPTERLANLFDYAMMMQARSACQKLGDELVARADLPEGLTQEQIYGALARSAAAPDRALAMLAKARDAAVAQGNSPARWLLTEIPLCLQLRNGDRLREILETLQTRHAREPGVMQALMNLLGEMGLAPGQAPTSPDDMAGMPPVDQPAAGQAVWSPDAPQPAAEAPAGGSQSGLWLPGMD
ncbi:MAG: hypothetical protein KDA41_04710, partial [Planctomycetales bacterium]|nr:hypothetical protein [Planctomycetales bacterium]